MKRLSVESRALLLLAFMILAFAIYGAGTAAPDVDDSLEVMPSRSTYSARPGGCKGLYLALQGSGYNASRFAKPWTDLPLGAVLISLSGPIHPTEEEWAALKAWVRAGGVAILAPPQISGTPEAQRAWMTLAPASIDGGLLRGVAQVEIYAQQQALRDFEVPTAERTWSRAVPLIAKDSRRVIEYASAGEGAVVMLTDPEMAANNGLTRSDNLRLLLNMVGPPTREVLFDEFHHGYGETPSVWSHLPAQTRLGLLQLVVGGLLLLWALSRRLGAPIGERAPVHERSEYVEAMATLLRRASATGLVARLLERRVRRRLSRELGVDAEADLVAAARAHGDDVAERTDRLLRRLRAGATVDDLLRAAEEEHSLSRDFTRRENP